MQSVQERFLRYVQIDTQSNPTSDTFPSTLKQKDLGKVLVHELQDLSIENAHMDEYGYVYATLECNDPDYSWPVIGLCSHMDTSPDAPWTDVKPLINDYQWWDIILPWDTTQILTVSENPDLASKVWEKIITSDGTTLLWADDKAGIAEIMTTLEYLTTHPKVKHSTLKICFTPDEEVGTGTKYLNYEKFNPDFAYTIDGWALGSFEYENFNAQTVMLIFSGYNVHPWFAKNKLINANRVASEFVSMLPLDHSPETTEWKQPYINVAKIEGDIGETTLTLMLRSFDTTMLTKYEKLIHDLAQQACESFPGSSHVLSSERRYSNMADYITHHPQVIEKALHAIREIWVEPLVHPIRGGTDGAHISEEWIPCPNLFAWGHNFHSVKEWVSVQDMEKAVKVILEIVSI